MATAAPRFLLAGEAALVVEYGDTIDRAIHDRVLALDAALAAAPIEGVTETAPSYRSLMIYFDPRILSTAALIDRLGSLDTGAPVAPGKVKRWSVPVCYDLPHAEDLAEVAHLLNMPQERVIALHSGALYRVYMYGFAPGFTFLGGLPDELFISRRASPRAPVTAGSLIIANGQAIITSFTMPTGWYNLGRTPAKAFDPRRERTFLVDIGDEIVFERIDLATFDALSAEAEAGALVAREAPR